VIDTHAHLDACDDPAEALVSRAREAGVSRFVAIGSGIDSCRATLAISEREQDVFCALGIHPHQAEGGEIWIDGLRELLLHDRVVAVGETGLDFYRDRASREAQRRLLSLQLDLARDVGLPVVVHCRDAEQEIEEALAAFEGTVILHCFSSPELLPTALDRGYYLSFAGNVTYPNADDLRVAAARVPPERLLAETDSPYLSPQPHRGRPNEPANVVHTVAALAVTRGDDFDELAALIDANATEAFALP